MCQTFLKTSLLSPSVSRLTCFLVHWCTLAPMSKEVHVYLIPFFHMQISVTNDNLCVTGNHERKPQWLILCFFSSTDVYIKKELLETSISASQANESVVRYVCWNVHLVVCVWVCTYMHLYPTATSLFSCHKAVIIGIPLRFCLNSRCPYAPSFPSHTHSHKAVYLKIVAKSDLLTVILHL